MDIFTSEIISPEYSAVFIKPTILNQFYLSKNSLKNYFVVTRFMIPELSVTNTDISKYLAKTNIIPRQKCMLIILRIFRFYFINNFKASLLIKGLLKSCERDNSWTFLLNL